MPTAKKAPAKKATSNKVTKTTNVTIKTEDVSEIIDPKPIRRPGRPPKSKSLSCTVYCGGSPVVLEFDNPHELEAAFVQICHKPLTGRPATVICKGKKYTFLKVDYLMRDI